MRSCLFAIFLSLFTLVQPGQAIVIDRVVAVVNEEPITLTELDEEGAHFFNKIKTQAPDHLIDEHLSRARREVLDTIIDRKLLLQRAERRGVTVSPEEIDMQFFRIMEQNKLTEEQFSKQLAKMGSTPKQYKENLKAQIVRQKLISYEIRSKVVVTDEDIEKYYREEYGLEHDQDGLHLLQIGVGWGRHGRAANETEARLKAEQLRGMVLAGERFDEIAKESSDLPSAADGGDIGILAQDELSEDMRRALAGLRPGQVTSIMQTAAGFQFFKLVSARQGNVVSHAPLEMVREEIRATLHERLMKKKFDDWVVKLREHSYIKVQL